MWKRTREQEAAYQLARYYARQREGFELLGGRCVVCGTTENLEFDHIDPQTKKFTISNLRASKAEWYEELKKCQLLCSEHHKEKTLRDLGITSRKGTHGMLSSYRHCGPPKCEACKKAKRDFAREHPSPSSLKRRASVAK